MSDIIDNKGYWKPTDKMLYGVMIKPFLPLVKHPELIHQNNCYANLFAGSQVYIFEITEDNKWCRAYFCSKPLPEEFLATMTAFGEQLPGINTIMVLFPKKFVHIFNDTDLGLKSFFDSPSQNDFNKLLSDKCITPTLFDTITNVDNNATEPMNYRKPQRPPFPYGRNKTRPLSQEIPEILFLLSSYIYSMYAAGEFTVFEHLANLYRELDEIRLILEFELCTKLEYIGTIRTASCLLTKISKYIFSKGKSNRILAHSVALTTDPSGFQGIFARDVNTGELLNFDTTDLQTLMTSSLFYGLTNNFPVAGHEKLIPKIPLPNLDSFNNFHLLADFKDIIYDSSIINPNLERVVASVYLRTATEILTEPYTISLDSNRDLSLSLKCSSVVLFKDLPDSIIKTNKVYLAVILTEKIPIQLKSNNKPNNSRSPFIPFKSATDGRIDSTIRGISGGVIDISSVFIDNDITSVVQPHKFKINLYSTNFDSLTETDKNTEENPGWGGVINKILTDSTECIMINPRTLSIPVSIIKIGSKTKLECFNRTSDLPIRTVKTNLLNEFDYEKEIIYLRVGKVRLLGLKKRLTNIKNVTVKMSCSNKNILLSKFSNVDASNEIFFVSVQPGELIGGRIRIMNVSAMGQNEELDIFVYLNGILLAKGKLPLKDSKIIFEHNNEMIDLMSSEGKSLVSLEVETEYAGNQFNIPKEIIEFFKLVKNFDYDSFEDEQAVLNILKNLKDTHISHLVKDIDRVLSDYLQLLQLMNGKDTTISSEKIFDEIFELFILFLKKVISCEDSNYRHKLFKLYHEFCKGTPTRLPKVGPLLLQYLSRAYKININGKNDYSTALCDTSVYIMFLSVVTSNSLESEWKYEFSEMFEGFCRYSSSSFEHIYIAQQSMLQTYDIWLSILELHFESTELFTLASMLLMSFEYKIDDWSEPSKTLSYAEEDFLNTKYLLIQRILLHDRFKEYLLEFEEDDPMILSFFTKCLNSTFVPYVLFDGSNSQIDTIRLANSVMMIVIRSISSPRILKHLIRLIPTYCQQFLTLRKYYKTNNLLNPCRSFTIIFPLEYPFPKFHVDSIVNDEIFVEVLLEIATLIGQLTKIASNLYGKNPSFMNIVNECRDDINFQSPLYMREMTTGHVQLIVKTIGVLFKGEFFPEKKWLAITALFARSSLMLLSMCEEFIISQNTPNRPTSPDVIDMKLWADFFRCLFMIGNHKISKLSTLATISRKAVYSISGNLRKFAAEILNECWDSLANGFYEEDLAKIYGIGQVSDYQMMLVKEYPSLISELFIFALHQDADATKISSKMFWSCTISIWRKYKSLQTCLDYNIPELYNGFQAGRIYLHEYEMNYFVQCVFHAIHIAVDDPMYNDLTEYLKEIIGFLNIIKEAYKIPKQEEYDDDRTSSQIEMFSYLLHANRPELFHDMINNIFTHSLKKKDYVQAALSLELLAGTYVWDPNDTLEAIPFPPLPSQSSFERKEYLYKEAAGYFSNGLKLEKALSVYKDLIKAYDEINYDLNGLAFVYDQISTIYTDMKSIDRLVPTYFKVSFMGFGFSDSIRNKKFILEGLPFEHITSMQNRLINVYHGSTIVQSQERVDQLLLKPTMGKYITVTTVEPRFHLSDEYVTSSKKSTLNNKIRMYIENRDLKTFSNSRRLPGATSVLDLWVEESTYTTVSTFPTLMYRAEITDIKVKKLSPIENAVRSLQNKIQELNGLENMSFKIIKEMGNSSEIFDELSRNITGTISAPINGGISQYKEFLKSPIIDSLSDSEVTKLTNAFNELVIVLNCCLNLHLQLLPSKDYKYTHDILVKLFEENFAEEIKRYNIQINTSTAPTAVISRGNSVKNPGNSRSLSIYDRTTAVNSHEPLSKDSKDSYDVDPPTKILSKYLGMNNTKNTSNLGTSLLSTDNENSDEVHNEDVIQYTGKE